jgi:hypothetical protein
MLHSFCTTITAYISWSAGLWSFISGVHFLEFTLSLKQIQIEIQNKSVKNVLSHLNSFFLNDSNAKNLETLEP